MRGPLRPVALCGDTDVIKAILTDMIGDRNHALCVGLSCFLPFFLSIILIEMHARRHVCMLLLFLFFSFFSVEAFEW